MSGGLHIKFARPSIVKIAWYGCPNCERRRPFMAWFEEWYGWTQTCLKCGDRFADGEWLARPFRPRWRKEHIESAKKFYRRYHPKEKP